MKVYSFWAFYYSNNIIDCDYYNLSNYSILITNSLRSDCATTKYQYIRVKCNIFQIYRTFQDEYNDLFFNVEIFIITL